MSSDKKPTILDRAKKLGEKIFTKRNVAIAAPIVAGAAALSSKRVRDAVGDAAKSAGDAIVKAAPARKKPAAAKPAASASAKKSAAGKTGAAKRTAKSATAKPATAKAGKPKAAAKPRAAKPRAKAAKPAATGGTTGNE
jgi:hypothetical protein